LKKRDEVVLGLLSERGVPVVVVMSGGYGKQIMDTVEIHLETVAAALGSWEKLGAIRV
jgi:hypothetical protein